MDIDLVNTDIIVPRAPCSFQIQPSGSVEEILSTEHTYLGQVHPYPYIFSSANVSLRIQKFPRPHVAYIHTHIHFFM